MNKVLGATALTVSLAVCSAVMVPMTAQAAGSAEITGKAYSDAGTPIRGLRVEAVRDGVVVASTATVSTGAYYLRKLAAGTYTVRYSDPTKKRYVSEYLGDAVTIETARTIVLSPSEKHSGVKENLTHSAVYSGVVTVAGQKANSALGAITATVTDAAGATVQQQDVAKSTFAFKGLTPGSYTFTLTPANADQVQATTQVFTVAAKEQSNDHIIDLALVPGAVQSSAITVTRKHSGSKMIITADVDSYGSVAGGTVSLKYLRAIHESADVAADGKARFVISTSGWKHHYVAQLNVQFSGTASTKSALTITHFTTR